MSSTTRTGGGMGIIALAAVVALGVGFMSIVKKDETQKHEKVSLFVTFSPTPREVPLTVTAYVGAAKVAEDLVTHAWWSYTVEVLPGTQVSLNANQETAGNMECSILVNGSVVDVKERPDIGSVRCYYNRTK